MAYKTKANPVKQNREAKVYRGSCAVWSSTDIFVVAVAAAAGGAAWAARFAGLLAPVHS